MKEQVFAGANNYIVCEPLEAGWEKRVESNGLIMTSTKTILLKATVAYDSEGGDDTCYCPGDVVFFPYNTASAPWAKAIYELGGKKVIFIPSSVILASAKSFDMIEEEPDDVEASAEEHF